VRFLLDFPWAAHEITTEFTATDQLRTFKSVCAKHHAAPVPFLSEADEAEIHSSRRQLHHSMVPFLEHIVRRTSATCDVEIDGSPSDLTLSWKAAVYDETANPESWRIPQILVPAERVAHWSVQKFVNIRRLPCAGSLESGPHRRVIAPLEQLEVHPHALPDFDPWDVRHSEASGTTASTSDARLPRPKGCSVPWNKLQSAIERERLEAREEPNERYYLPPKGWLARDCAESDWRSGHAFPRVKCSDFYNRYGFVDHLDRIWVWDSNEGGHWDVQYGGRGNYESVWPSGVIKKQRR
jgi:hypothetical protein